MPRRVRWALLSTIAAVLIIGCSPPSELSFSVDDEASVTDVDENQIESETSRSATLSDDVSDSSTNADATLSPQDSTTATAIEQSFGVLITQWTDCFHRPGRCEVNRLTASESPERKRLGDSIAFYTAEQLRTKPDEGRLEWSIESLSITSSDRARLLTCEYDTRIFFDVSMSDTELGDIIFDATVWTRHVEWTIAKINDSWQLWSRRIERRSPAVRFCTP